MYINDINCFAIIFNGVMNHFKKLAPDYLRDLDESSESYTGFYAINQVLPKFKNLFLCEKGIQYFQTQPDVFNKLSLRLFLQNNIHPKHHKVAFQVLKSKKTQSDESLEFLTILLRPSTKDYFSTHLIALKHLSLDQPTILFQVFPIEFNHIQRKLNRLQDEWHFMRKFEDRFMSLTPREKVILIETSLGESSKRIAETLFISTNTVETHKKNIQKKIGGKKKDFILFALSFDLIDYLFKKYL